MKLTTKAPTLDEEMTVLHGLDLVVDQKCWSFWDTVTQTFLISEHSQLCTRREIRNYQ